MKTLTESDVIRIMQEEWHKRVSQLSEEVDIAMTAKVDNKSGEKSVLTPDLKVMHKDSGIRYTITSVGPRDVILKTPEGDQFIVDADSLEREYKLD